MRANARRTQLHGVEPRDLPVSHVLAGQQGLFATRMWHQFDVLGEYCGEVLLTIHTSVPPTIWPVWVSRTAPPAQCLMACLIEPALLLLCIRIGCPFILLRRVRGVSGR